MTPTPIDGEGDKAFAAFKLFCEQDTPSVVKVASQLSKSRQLVTRWCSKYRWRERFAALRQHEIEQKIQAEAQAVEAVAAITEERRARVAERAFTIAEEMIEAAGAIMSEHPVSSARLLATGITVVQAIGGSASGYQVPPVNSLQFITVNAEGAPLEEPPPIDLAEAEKIVAAFQSNPAHQIEWNIDADSTPVPSDKPDTTRAHAREDTDTPAPVERRVPSRVDTWRGSDGRNAKGEEPPLQTTGDGYRCGVVKVEGL